MENNNVIPNVSSVFRQLVQISHLNPKLASSNHQTPSPNPYSLQGFSNQLSSYDPRADFISNMGIDDRQRRHEELMNKFKNSFEQNRQLLQVEQQPKYQERSSYQTKNFEPLRSRFDKYPNVENPNGNFFSKAGGLRKWVAPQIKYRHIIENDKLFIQSNQGMSENSLNEEQNEEIKTNQKLKEQFYGNGLQSADHSNAKLEQKQNIHNNKTQQSGQAEKQQEPNMIQEPKTNLNYRLPHKASKYSQNLQSYYDLIRKPTKPFYVSEKGSNKEQKSNNSEKFIRKPSGKVTGINLEKAMKILSLDQ